MFSISPFLLHFSLTLHAQRNFFWSAHWPWPWMNFLPLTVPRSAYADARCVRMLLWSVGRLDLLASWLFFLWLSACDACSSDGCAGFPIWQRKIKMGCKDGSTPSLRVSLWHLKNLGIPAEVASDAIFIRFQLVQLVSDCASKITPSCTSSPFVLLVVNTLQKTIDFTYFILIN